VKLVVYPHVMEIGGSQLNAVELAAAVRDLGHQVVIFGQPGPLLQRVRELQLEFVESPPLGRRPSWRVMSALSRLVEKREIDLVHGYEWTTALEIYGGPRAWLGVPAVATVMSMAVAPFLPFDLPLIVGTEQIAAYERARGRSDVFVLEPPVDTQFNDPLAALPMQEFRQEFGLDDTPTVVCVTRLVSELKLEGLLAAIDVIGEIALSQPLRLLVVGDGPARSLVAERAAAANARAGSSVVVLTGELTDPRPAYALADICLGMGGSALRAMSFGKPLLVQGEGGFWETLDPATAQQFLWTGWYGVGDDPNLGAAALRGRLLALLADQARRHELGAFGRTLVEERFSLEKAGHRQLGMYQATLDAWSRKRRSGLVPAGIAAGGFLKYKAQRKLARALGRGSGDDFNARPVAARERARPAQTGPRG
jgi:glycosyltransferase involved in cell wall biosynthesis